MAHRCKVITPLLALVLVACGDDGPPPDAAPPDTIIRRPPVDEPWEIEELEGEDHGTHLHMVTTGDGNPALAYFPTYSRRFGLCGEIGGTDIPEKTLWDLHYRERRGGSWEEELVTSVLHSSEPPGLDLRVSPDGDPIIAVVTGEPWVRLRYCSANDVGVFAREADAWTMEVAVRTSGEAMTGMPASDYGEVIGHWPGLAVSDEGRYIIAYQDVHAGGIQQDDFKRADLEAAYGAPGAWTALPVAIGEGAGRYNRATFDTDGNPYIVYYNPQEFIDESSRGVFVARSLDDGMTWESVRLGNVSTSDGPDILHGPEGAIYAAYYNADAGHVVVATLRDSENFTSLSDGWELEVVGDGAYDEGQNPNLGLSLTGTLLLSYRRCGLATRRGMGCTPADDALIFAYRSGGTWTLEVVEEGPTEGSCGTYPTLTLGPAGEIWVAYVCQQYVDDVLTNRIHFAERRALE